MSTELNVFQIWINLPSLHSHPTQIYELKLCGFCFVCLFPLLDLWLDEKNFTDGRNWPGQHMRKTKASANGQAEVLLQTETEGRDWLRRPKASSKQNSLGSLMPGWCEGQGWQQKTWNGGFLESASYNSTYSDHVIWTGPLGLQLSMKFSASCLGAGLSRSSLVLSKGSSWNYFCLSTSMPSSKAWCTSRQLQLHSAHWLCPWLRTQSAGSLEKVLTAQLVEATPTHLGNLYLAMSIWHSGGLSLPWYPKVSERKVRALCTMFINCKILV